MQYIYICNIYIYIYIYMQYIYICNIYIYIRATPGFCPGVAAYMCPIHEQMMLQIAVIPMGKITQVLETIKQTRSKHPKFLWEKQNGITPAIPMEKTAKVLANFKLSNRESQNSIRKINKDIREY